MAHRDFLKGSRRVKLDPDTVNIFLREITHKDMSVSTQRHTQRSRQTSPMLTHTHSLPSLNMMKGVKKRIREGVMNGRSEKADIKHY